MELDPLPADVRLHLRNHFQDVKDEPLEGENFVFSMNVHGKRKLLKVHRNVFMFPDVISQYLRDMEFARQLERSPGDVQILEPHRDSPR